MLPLNRAQLSAIGHGGLPFWSPVTVTILDRLLDGLAIPSGAHVLDIGCGDGAMLAHVAGRLSGTGTGVDWLPEAIQLARRHSGRLRWRTSKPEPGVEGEPPADLILAVGSLGAEEAAPLPGRALLLGELVTVGTAPLEMLPRPGRRIPEQYGWRFVEGVLLDEQALRDYESWWLRNVRAWADAHPEVDLTAPIAAHAALLEAGGLGFELTAWRRAVN